MTSMQTTASDGAPAPYWSLAGIRAGAALMVPALPGIVVFGAAFGALAAQKGMSLFEATLMSGMVFAGVAQIVSMEIWTPVMTLGVIVAVVLTTLVVNLRMVLIGGSLQPWLAGSPPWQVYPSLFVLTDTNWVGAVRYRREGGSDVGFLFGGGLIIWLTFVPSTAIGHLFGTLIADPRRFGIDLILPIYFVALLSPMFESSRRAIPWVVAGVTAITVQHFVPGFWFIIAGTLAGAITGGFIDDE